MTGFFSILGFMLIWFWLNPDSAGKWLRKAKTAYENYSDKEEANRD